MVFNLLDKKSIHYNTLSKEDKDKEAVKRILESQGSDKTIDEISMRERNAILSQHKKASYVGKCPQCKMEIIEHEAFYGCSGYKNNCKFSLNKSNIGKFLDTFRVPHDAEFIKSLVINALKGTPLVVKLCSPRTGVFFDKKIGVEKNEKGYWGLNMQDTRKRVE